MRTSLQALSRLIILTTMLLGTGIVLSQEASPTPEIPQLIAGEAISGEIESSVSTNLYTFTGTAGDAVTISMLAGDPTLDPFLILMDTQGGVLADNDDREEGVRDAAIEAFTLPVDGMYIVFATTWQNIDEFLEISPESPLPYTITAEGFTPPASAEIEALNTTPITSGEIYEGRSTVDLPVTYLTLDAAAGDTYDVLMRRVEGVDPVLHIFTPDGERIGFDDDDDTADTFTLNAAVYGLNIPADGTYLIIATDTFFYNAGKENVSLSYEPGRFEVEVVPVTEE